MGCEGEWTHAHMRTHVARVRVKRLLKQVCVHAGIFGLVTHHTRATAHLAHFHRKSDGYSCFVIFVFSYFCCLPSIKSIKKTKKNISKKGHFTRKCFNSFQFFCSFFYTKWHSKFVRLQSATTTFATHPLKKMVVPSILMKL